MKSVCLLAAAMVLSPGCGGEKDKKAGSGGEGSASSESTPQTKLVAQVNGKSVTFAGAFAWTMGSKHRIKLSFEAKPTTCAEIRKKSYSKDPTQRFDLVGRLQPDGSTAWQLGSSFGDDTVVTTSVDTKPGGKIAGTITVNPTKSSNKKLTGQFEAVSCGDFGRARSIGKRAAAAKPRPQKLAITLAGVTFPIQGARVRKSSRGYRVELNSAPMGCKGSYASDFKLSISLNEDGSPRSLNVGGDVLATAQSLPPSSVQGLEISLNGALAGSGNLTGTLAGSATFRDYKLSFNGGFDAIRCTK